MKICLVNASNPLNVSLESDSYTDFRGGRASCFEGDKCIKQCRSWHGWPYALETEFFVFGKDGFNGVFNYDGIVILVNRDMQAVLPLVKKLKLMKKKVAISFHEGVGDLIGSSGIPNENPALRWVGLYDLVQAADFYVNLFGQMQTFFEGWFGKNKVKYCQHGTVTDWEAIKIHRVPFDERPYDILIGTRTLNQRLPRNTMVTLGVANKFANEGKKVLYISEDGDVKELFKKIGFDKIEVQVGARSWEEWLKLIAKCKVVAHFDDSLNLGQIAADCAMMDVACVGSTCWNNEIQETGDSGQSDVLSNLISGYIEHNGISMLNNVRYRNNFYNTLHPDRVKERLLEIFNE